MKNSITREAYGNTLVAMAEELDFLVFDADLAKATQTIKFKEKYPHRFFDMGIAEANMMSTAAGVATCGKLVFASTFAMFAAGRAYEQIRNSIAYPNLHVIIGATHAGVLIGEDGASHQAIEDISLMRGMPNMTVLAPCDEISVVACMRTAIKHNGPVYIRFGRNACQSTYENDFDFEIGQGKVVRDGSDLTIIAIGDMVSEAVKACDELEKLGVSVALIDMISIKPLDEKLVIQYAEKTKKIITIEDHSIIGGLGSAVAEVLAENPSAKLRRIGVKDCFGRSGNRADLQEFFNLNAEEIIKTYKKM